MPKAKRPLPSDNPKIPAKDLDAFKAALGGEAQDDDQENEPVDIETKDVGPDQRARHIPVSVDEAPEEESDDKADEQPESSPRQPTTPPPPTKFDRAKRQWPWGWIIGGFLIAAAAAVAGFFVFNHQAKFNGNNIQVVVHAPKQIASGGDVTLTIDLQNQEAVDIVNGQLAIDYPDGFTYTSSSVTPTNEFSNSFPIGKLGSGRAMQVTIEGTVIGSVNSQLTFGATLTYRPANFSSDFQEQGSATVTISSSILQLTIDGPSKVAPGGTASWTLTAKNTSDHDLSKIRLTATLPDSLKIVKATPAASDNGTTWDIPSIAKGKSSVVTLQLQAQGNTGDSLELKVQAGILNNEGTVDLQDEQSTLIILVNTGLSTTIGVNGQTDPVVIKPGDTLNYTISVANKSDAEVADVTVAATLSGRGYDLSTLSNPLQATVKDQTLTWTKNQVAGLSLIEPGSTVSLTLSIGTTSTLTVSSDSDRNPNVSLSVALSSPALSTSTNSSTSPAVSVTKFSTLFSVTADARYYDDSLTKVGSGPVPPKVGQTTTYRVLWSVTNTTNDATDMSVTTTLPTGVLWTGQNIGRDAGDISFDPASRTVRWTLNKVPAGTGGRLPRLTAHFDVSITPSADQVGNIVVLTDTTNGTATDSYSSQALTQTASSLTSDVPNDPQAAGEGKVVSS